MSNPPPPGDEDARVRALTALARMEKMARFLGGTPSDAMPTFSEDIEAIRAALSPAAPASGGTPGCVKCGKPYEKEAQDWLICCECERDLVAVRIAGKDWRERLTLLRRVAASRAPLPAPVLPNDEHGELADRIQRARKYITGRVFDEQEGHDADAWDFAEAILDLAILAQRASPPPAESSTRDQELRAWEVRDGDGDTRAFFPLSDHLHETIGERSKAAEKRAREQSHPGAKLFPVYGYADAAVSIIPADQTP